MSLDNALVKLCNIEEEKSLMMDNVLAYRGVLCLDDIVSKIEQMKKYVNNKDIEIKSMPVVCIFGIFEKKHETYCDVEIMFEINKKIKIGHKFHIKDRFRLYNAVKGSFMANIKNMENINIILNKYMIEKKMLPISNVYVVIPNKNNILETTRLDVYVGISPNEL